MPVFSRPAKTATTGAPAPQRMPASVAEVSRMSLVRLFFVAGFVLALAACKTSGDIDGYDADSPSARESDWCSQSPPSGYCNTKGD